MSFRSVFGLKKTIVIFAFLVGSCAVNEPVVQSQSANNSQLSRTTEIAQQPSDGIISNSNEVDYFAHLHPKHREVLRDWLTTKKNLRPAVEEIDNGIFQETNYQDKENYTENRERNMKMLRESVGENGYQYYSVGDMNLDGKEDFAVLLIDSRNGKELGSFSLAIFNGPFEKGEKPSYFEENLHGISNSYIAFDKMIEKHLFLGRFESDVYCATYYPRGNTYFFKDCLDE